MRTVQRSIRSINKRSIRALQLCIVLACCTAGCLAQTLARRGWAGSGITVEPWWKSAVFYRVDPLAFESSVDARDAKARAGFRSIAGHLDYLQELGVDAVLLSSRPDVPPMPGQSGPAEAESKPFDPRYGSDEDLNVLLAEASRRKIRILVDLDIDAPRSTEDLSALVRFWLSRGAAGFRLLHPAPMAEELSPVQHAERLHQLRRACASGLGQRVLIWERPGAEAAAEEPYHNAFPRHAELSHAQPGHAQPGHASPASREERTSQAQAEMFLDPRLAQLTHLDAASLRYALRRAVVPGHGLRDGMTNPTNQTDRQGTPRSFNRLGDGAHNVATAKLLATTLLASSASTLLDFGQEIGLDGASGSMPWGKPDARSGVPQPNAGATANAANVAAEEADPDSLLNWYRKLIFLHHANAALHGGSTELLESQEPETIAWIRRSTLPGHASSAVLVVCNLSPHPVAASLTGELERLGLPVGLDRLQTLATLGEHAEPTSDDGRLRGIALPAYGVYLGELRPQPGLESAVLPVKATRSHTSRSHASRARSARSSIGR